MLHRNLEVFSAHCNKDMVAELVGDDVPDGNYGYLLIRDRLVPYSFLQRLVTHLLPATFEYGAVFSAEEMVGSQFLSTLNEGERQVLGDCLLYLIKEGRIAVYFPGDEFDEDSD